MKNYIFVVTDLKKHLPFAPKGIAIKFEGEYIIALDEHLPANMMETVYKHELAHVLLGHLDRNIDREIMEKEADEYAAQMSAEEFIELKKYARA